MNPLLALGLGVGGLVLLLRRQETPPSAPVVPPTVPPTTMPPTTVPPTTVPPAVDPPPNVTALDVEGRSYVVTHYGGGHYKVELMSTKGPVAALSFGQSGAPIRSGDDTLIDKYILSDIHKFPSNVFPKG